MLTRCTLHRWLVGPAVLSLAATLPAGSDILQVGCNCNRGGGMPLHQPVPEYMPAQSYAPAPIQYDTSYAPPVAYGQSGSSLVVNPSNPPPGTLGRTYQLPTKLAPADSHPRVAFLDIQAPNADEVRVDDTYEFREEDNVVGYESEETPGLWHFKTKPLIPGQPNVVKIELLSDGDVIDTRYVRLLPNRIIELSF